MAETKISVDDLSIDELLDLKDAIERRLDRLAAGEVGAIEKRLERLKRFMNGDAKPAQPATATAAAPAKVRKKPGPKPGRKKKAAASASKSKLPPKFRDPATGKTWSGRGPAPAWLRAYAAKKGNKREDLAV